MKYATKYGQSVTNLRKLSKQDTALHRVPPVWKAFALVVVLLTVLASAQTSLAKPVGGICLVLLATVLGKIPLSFVFGKFKMALPFVLFIGISNVLFAREPWIGWPLLTVGMVSCLVLVLKTFVSIGLMTIFVATTTREEILELGKKLHISPILLLQIELTLRYLGVLVEETERMHRAYHLKQPKSYFIAFKDMETFLGLLLLRTLARAERVYEAMKCRGYGYQEE